METVTEIETPHGTARARLAEPARPAIGLLVLTHGAGGDVDASDIVAVRDAAVAAGIVTARVTQPYRVAGRAMPGANTVRQDAAWCGAVRTLRADERWSALPLAVGGRSNGARVACRSARALGAVAVVALAFPLHPPGKPQRSRAQELRDAGVATLVVNGDRDPFGVPDESDATTLIVRPGERHDLAKDPCETARLVVEWLWKRTSGAL